MKHINSFRPLFSPLQPSIAVAGGQVSYTEFMPDEPLQHLVYCYWQLKSNSSLNESFQYRVVADGCTDIFFELQCPQENFVTGFNRQYTSFNLGHSFNYVGIRFLPAGFTRLFGINAAELSNRSESLELVVPEISAFIGSCFSDETSVEEVNLMLNSYFTGLLAKDKTLADHRVFHAIDIILKKSGTLNIEKDLDVGLSIRQLNRLFEFYTGDNPKTFSKIVRFQHLLRAKTLEQYPSKNKLFLDAGYFDQAHFIKEFKTLYGLTPFKAFGH